MQHGFRVLLWDVAGSPLQLCCDQCQELLIEGRQPAAELGPSVWVVPFPQLLHTNFSVSEKGFASPLCHLYLGDVFEFDCEMLNIAAIKGSRSSARKSSSEFLVFPCCHTKERYLANCLA